MAIMASKFLGPKFTKFLLEPWLLPKLCSKVLNPEKVSATNIAYSHYSLTTDVLWNIFPYFYQTLPQLEQSSFFLFGIYRML